MWTIFRCWNFRRFWQFSKQWVRDGDVYSLEELRFGWMAMIDPERKSEEFRAAPGVGGEGDHPRFAEYALLPQEDPESLAFMGYGNPTVCVVNAQTGEKYDFVNDDRGKPAVCYGSADLGEDSAIEKRRRGEKAGALVLDRKQVNISLRQPVRLGPCIPET